MEKSVLPEKKDKSYEISEIWWGGGLQNLRNIT